MPEPTTPAERAAHYSAEIRDYLIGRVARSARGVPLKPPRRPAGMPPPVLWWWVFEGKAYPGIAGALADNWSWLARQVRAVLRTFNPRLTVRDVPEGRVDWVRTIQWNAGGPFREFVCESSNVGLNEDELRALEAWTRWLLKGWVDYCRTVRTDRDPEEAMGLRDTLAACGSTGRDPDVAQLRRAAHIAKRSRWPVLRGVVAESLWCAIDIGELDRIPLPSDLPTLFEMLCLVRVLRTLEPQPTVIRWLIHGTGNQIELPGVRCWFQRSFGVSRVLESGAFGPGLVEAIRRFAVDGYPRQSDVVVELVPPRSGVDGILIEAKSGEQQYGATLYQLQVYRAALGMSDGRLWIAWGIVEQPAASRTTPTDVTNAVACPTVAANRTVWLFSGPDEIDSVLATLDLGTQSPQMDRMDERAWSG